MNSIGFLALILRRSCFFPHEVYPDSGQARMIPKKTIGLPLHLLLPGELMKARLSWRDDDVLHLKKRSRGEVAVNIDREQLRTRDLIAQR